MRERIRRAFANLPPKYRLVATLALIEDAPLRRNRRGSRHLRRPRESPRLPRDAHVAQTTSRLIRRNRSPIVNRKDQDRADRKRQRTIKNSPSSIISCAKSRRRSPQLNSNRAPTCGRDSAPASTYNSLPMCADANSHRESSRIHARVPWFDWALAALAAAALLIFPGIIPALLYHF